MPTRIMPPSPCRFTVGMCLLAASVFQTTIGCGSSGSRIPIEGSVTFDGKPIPKGQINFIPLPGTSGPTAGSVLSDGSYSIPAEQGLKAGRYRVEITAMRPTSQRTQTMNMVTGEMETAEAVEAYLPSRYNSESELTAEVKADGPNRFNFALTP